MERIIQELENQMKMGYSPLQLEVDYGYCDNDPETEGYYISEQIGLGIKPITNVIATAAEVEQNELIKHLGEMDIAHCLQ